MATWDDTAKFAGKLRGTFVLVSAAPRTTQHFTPDGSRYTDAQLAEMAAWQPGAAGPGAGGRGNFPRPAANAFRATADTAALR